MGTFASQIDRRLATRLGEEAVTIGELGEYQAPSGVKVDIRTIVAAAVAGTVTYPPDMPTIESGQGPHDTRIEVANETTLSAGKQLIDAGCNAVILNFASARSPGGGFLSGARAQQEYLARSSCLYECIRSNPMYEFHRLNDDPLYSNYAIYSPGVPVFRDDNHSLLEQPYNISIITSPAAYAKGLVPHRRAEIAPAMWRRILKVLALGVEHGHDGIVLGALCCGAFGNDGREIAHLFHKALSENFRGAYRRVIFAIVDWSADRKFIGPFEAQFRG
jgi:uncharacterized protein (TIGR02452 family)